MRIVAIDPIPDDRRGGQERSLFDVLTGLRGRGHEVRLAYLQDGNFVPRYEAAGVQCVRIDRTWVERKTSLREWRELGRSAASRVFRNADVIYANQFMDVPVACLAGAARRTPVVCHLRLPPMPFGFQHRIWLRRVQAFVVPSVTMRDEHFAAGWPGETLKVIPHGFHFPEQLPPWPRAVSTPLRMLCLGRITKAKGLDTALDVISLLVRRGVAVQLDICGPALREDDRACREHLRARIREFRLPARILEPVQDGLGLLRTYDVSLFVSQWESFPRVVVESIMAGVPVIARRVGTVPEMLGTPGQPWLFRNTEEAVLAVEAYARDPAAYPLSALFEAARNRYSWQHILAEIEDVLQRAAST